MFNLKKCVLKRTKKRNKFVENNFMKIKQVKENRNAKINWMKDKVKSREIKEKQLEEIERK